MFGFLSKKQPPAQPVDTGNDDSSTDAIGQRGLFKSLSSRLSKTRQNLTEGMADLVLGKKSIDDELLEELENRLLMADVGIEATTGIISDLTSRVSRKELNNPDALFEALCDDMVKILQPCEQTLATDTHSPFVILVVGINGAGKTTTIGKLARKFQNQGKSIILAAGDTFRAAAVEQLQTWGERNNIPVIAQGTGADSASVIFDAIESAKAKNIDIVIADTAGRLHTQANLMDELKKIKRVMTKLDDNAPHETLLVMDAGFGQNGLIQAQQFHDALGLTGLALTKLDGTAKGGIVFAIAKKLALPIRFIGIGEGVEDLLDFQASDFVNALLDKE
ncbi:MAG: signal recognition particle-docking protein FtsY [Gammaproteobacteria bacterium]|nr:signal recognition particle-docking protein FtsY [Gammaproteobacteria bacterium]